MIRLGPLLSLAIPLAAFAAGALADPALECADPCAAPPPLEFTVRGGAPDRLRVGEFTPRSHVGESVRGVEAGVRAFGVDIGGAFIDDGREGGAGDSLGFGAAYDFGPLSVGGGVSLGLQHDAGGAAGVGLSWRAREGLTLGGALAIAEPGAEGAAGPADVSAGVNVRLDF
jgi:hypothetical protein